MSIETRKEQVPENEKVERITDVVFKLSKRAKWDSEDNPKNKAAKILQNALKNEDLQGLLDKQPKFYLEEEGAATEIHFADYNDSHIQAEVNRFEAFLRLSSFEENPTLFIEEKGKIIDRGCETMKDMPDEERTVRELIKAAYDISRVRVLEFEDRNLGSESFVVKRVDSKKTVQNEVEEFEVAKKAYENDIPTPLPYGYVKDQGNSYLFFENVKGNTLLELRRQFRNPHQNPLLKSHIRQIFHKLKSFKEEVKTKIDDLSISHKDFNERNIIYSDAEEKFYLIDWEQKGVGDFGTDKLP